MSSGLPAVMTAADSTGQHRTSWLLSSLCWLIVLPGITLTSVSGAGPLEEPAAFVVELHQDPTIPSGRVAVLDGSTSSAGVWLKVPDLSIDQAVLVALSKTDNGPPLTLGLYKFHWAAPSRELSTDDSGRCSTQFRTQGDLFVRVLSSGPIEGYRLLVWVDEKVQAPLTPVLTPKAKRL
jgi:hypothetical protein